MARRDYILGVDLDGCVVDYYRALRPIAAEWLGKSEDELPMNFSWGMTEWGIPEDGELGFDYLHRFAVVKRRIFETAPPIPLACATMRRLSDLGVRIRIVTHRLCIDNFHETALIQTARWLEKYGVPYWDICFLKDKNSINADLFIDDSPVNIEKFKAASKRVLIFGCPNNMGVQGDRADDWNQVYDYVKKDMESLNKG
ncbi:MAG: 5'-nucleotidase [Candidatus Wallbacteria bacterium HGW-Wallbacteria-1]|jgi:beta-phosphoglucomutase-like phosphatase (HAD superfamily)|uniref:5'-nucleotidase n=1 Tax=Candidatus Wallbacteria bacterium HGW-Wallbacteria-1 TaxID=2013854 RepID=A0A2N1PMU7_9BACT|nr:MAG: 5'-nucleotidase [Candidatus Wallbacteria bacterium HGW-Wallbacteria-1]